MGFGDMSGVDTLGGIGFGKRSLRMWAEVSEQFVNEKRAYSNNQFKNRIRGPFRFGTRPAAYTY